MIFLVFLGCYVVDNSVVLNKIYGVCFFDLEVGLRNNDFDFFFIVDGFCE